MNLSLPFSHYLILLFFLLLSHKISCCPTSPHANYAYIKKSCQTTLYPNLCNRTLARHATEIKTSPKRLAMTALLVTFNATRSASKRLTRLSRNRASRRGEKAALAECVEEIGDSVYQLQRSVEELNHTRRLGPEFELRISNVQTWVSAALTDDDTCMDDFATRGKMKFLVRRLVLRISRLTSIALAFINNYAAA